MEFEGVVQFRSSAAPSHGPPGEAEVLALNPERASRILEATGWPRLEPGSLNLTVAPSVVDSLMGYEPALVESALLIVYPRKYAHIPKLREAYYYFSGVVQAVTGGDSYDVLVRRAKNPVQGRVELFASVSLKSALGLASGDRVRVTLGRT